MGSVSCILWCPNPRQAHGGVSQCVFAADMEVQNIMKTVLAVPGSQFQLSCTFTQSGFFQGSNAQPRLTTPIYTHFLCSR